MTIAVSVCLAWCGCGGADLMLCCCDHTLLGFLLEFDEPKHLHTGQQPGEVSVHPIGLLHRAVDVVAVLLPRPASAVALLEYLLHRQTHAAAGGLAAPGLPQLHSDGGVFGCS